MNTLKINEQSTLYRIRKPAIGPVIGWAILLLPFLSSCNQEPKPKRAYLVGKSDDNNWTTSAIIECDSVSMVSKNEAVYYVDGRESRLFGEIIKIASNPYHVQNNKPCQ